jgi:putative copper resistance protein D
VLVAALLLGGGAAPPAVPGLPDPGVLTGWGLPVATLVEQAAAVVCVGFLLLAAVLPPVRGDLGRDGLVAMRLASTCGLVWCLATVAVHLLTLSDLVGLPLAQALSGSALASFTLSVEPGQATALVILLTATLAVAARLTVGHGGAVALLALAIGALVPPALTGHAATGDYHHSASVSLAVHVVAVSLWVGGLVAIATYAGGRAPHLGRVTQAFSPLAGACAVAVAATGVLNGYVRLPAPTDLVTTRYGWLLLAKAALLVVLLAFGRRHRRRTLPEVAAGRPGAFRSLAGVEVLVMAATVALGVALSRTPPPAGPTGPESLTRQLLGFVPPPEPTVARLFTQTYPDAFFVLVCLAAALLYGGGVVRLRRRGDGWPVGRIIAWYLGVASLAFATTSGLMTYGMTVLSWHMSQHMVLAMVSPMLLVMGGPVTLALRALRPAPRGESGPREWLLAAVQSRAVRVLTQPLVVLALVVSAPFMIYFTGLFEYAMRHHTAHTLMELHFLLAGYLFAEVLVGIDPLPKRPPFVARLVLLFASMAFHAFFGVALMSSARLVAGDWYRTLAEDIGWLPAALDAQRTAGQIAWGFGELPALVMAMVMLVQWSRADEREARRRDRHGDDDLAAYNAYLAGLESGRAMRGGEPVAAPLGRRRSRPARGDTGSAPTGPDRHDRGST